MKHINHLTLGIFCALVIPTQLTWGTIRTILQINLEATRFSSNERLSLLVTRHTKHASTDTCIKAELIELKQKDLSRVSTHPLETCALVEFDSIVKGNDNTYFNLSENGSLLPLSSGPSDSKKITQIVGSIDSIHPLLFSAASDGDVLVTDNQLNTATSMPIFDLDPSLRTVLGKINDDKILVAKWDGQVGPLPLWYAGVGTRHFQILDKNLEVVKDAYLNSPENTTWPYREHIIQKINRFYHSDSSSFYVLTDSPNHSVGDLMPRYLTRYSHSLEYMKSYPLPHLGIPVKVDHGFFVWHNSNAQVELVDDNLNLVMQKEIPETDIGSSRETSWTVLSNGQFVRITNPFLTLGAYPRIKHDKVLVELFDEKLNLISKKQIDSSVVATTEASSTALKGSVLKTAIVDGKLTLGMHLYDETQRYMPIKGALLLSLDLKTLEIKNRSELL